MCDAASMLMAMQGISAVQQGRSARTQANAEAVMLDMQAEQEREAGAQAAGKIRQRTKLERGAARAQYAASGIRVGEGSAADIDRYLEEGGEEDAMLTLLNADRRARAAAGQGTMLRIGGKAAERAGWMSGVNSLLNIGARQGWRRHGPGFSGTQAPAPVEERRVGGVSTWAY